MGVTTDPLLCKHIQRNLIDYDGGLISQSEKPLTGTLDALTSAQNTRGIQQIQGLVRGSTPSGTSTASGDRIISLRGFNADCTVCTNVDGDDDPLPKIDGCNWTSTTDAATPVSYAFPVTQFSCAPSVRFELDDMWKLCDGKDEVITNSLRKLANQVKRDINTKLVASAISLMGKYSNGVNSISSPYTLKLLGSTFAPNHTEWARLQESYFKKGYNQKPIVVGGSMLSQVKAMTSSLGLASTGINLGGTMFPELFLDYDVDTVYDDAAHHILTWAPGTFQLLEWYEHEQPGKNFKGALIEVDGKMMYEEEWSVINIDGIDYDYYGKYDKCGGYKIALKKEFDLAALPSAAFCTNKFPAHQFLLDCGTPDCASLSLC